MRIAFVSHEFPLETGGGGIGTYLQHAAHALTRAGHDVTVFCGATTRSREERHEGVVLNLTRPAEGEFFRDAVLPRFSAAHQARPFDVIEGCDFDASALRLKEAYPSLPYVVKLHTPRFFIDELHQKPLRLRSRLGILAGALRRGRLPRFTSIRESSAAQAELRSILLADRIAAPSQAIATLAASWAPIDSRLVDVFPYPFAPDERFLQLPVASTGQRVTFIGRMEERKGILDLAEAIPLIVQKQPHARFRFVGRDQPSPAPGVGMQQYLRERLAGFPVEILGPVANAEIPRFFAETDVAVFPSHWENHAMICCEAMAAGRCIVATDNSGFSELLDQGSCGVLVPPRDSAALAHRILELLADPARRHRLGAAARARLLSHFSYESVVPLQLASYERAIRRATAATARGDSGSKPPFPSGAA